MSIAKGPEVLTSSSTKDLQDTNSERSKTVLEEESPIKHEDEAGRVKRLNIQRLQNMAEV